MAGDVMAIRLRLSPEESTSWRTNAYDRRCYGNSASSVARGIHKLEDQRIRPAMLWQFGFVCRWSVCWRWPRALWRGRHGCWSRTRKRVSFALRAHCGGVGWYRGGRAGNNRIEGTNKQIQATTGPSMETAVLDLLGKVPTSRFKQRQDLGSSRRPCSSLIPAGTNKQLQATTGPCRSSRAR